MDTNASSIIPIPLHTLRPSALNARTIDGKSLDELAASIAAEGLLQNLTVTQADDGGYEVVAGERRRRAMLLLQERNLLPPELESVPCLIVENGRAMSASLAENSVREKMHPADEFVAFSRLAEQGKSIEEIAAEFGIQPLHVQRHLKLAKVAPSLFELYRQDKIGLDQMHALAVTDDHRAQELAWATPNSWERQASALREKLTRSDIDISRDTVARFVGREAIIAAGGIVRTDLFGSADGGLTDERALINQLALDKLRQHADAVKEEGWSWVDAAVSVSRDELYSSRRVHPETGARPLSSAEQTRLEALEAEFGALQDVLEDSSDGCLNAEQGARYDQIEGEVDEIKARTNAWSTKQLAAAGAFVTIGAGGALVISRGHLRDGEIAPRSSSTQGAGKAGGEKAKKPDMSGSMTMRLTAHRTAILQGAIAQQPELALVVLAHALMQPVFYRGHSDASVSKISQPQLLELEQLASELPLARSWNRFHDHVKGLREDLPGAPDLFAWLLEQPAEKVRALIAACVGLSIDTVVRYGEESKAIRRAVIDLTHAAGVDYTDHWEPTREAFLNHVPRAVIEAAVLEAHDKHAVDKLANLKKDKLVDAAEILLAGKKWLPKIMRLPPAKAAPSIAAEKPPAKAAPSIAAEKPPAKAAPSIAAEKPPAKAAPSIAAEKPPAKAAPSIAAEKPPAKAAPSIAAEKPPAKAAPSIAAEKPPAKAAPSIAAEKPPAKAAPSIAAEKPPAKAAPSIAAEKPPAKKAAAKKPAAKPSKKSAVPKARKPPAKKAAASTSKKK